MMRSDPKTDFEWFKHFLYRDPDFIVFAEQFNIWYKGAVDEKVQIVLDLTTHKGRPLKNELEILGASEGVELIEAAAKQFEIPEHVVEFGFIKRPEIRGVDEERRPVLIRPGTNMHLGQAELAIKVYPNTRWKDVKDLWAVVESAQKELEGYMPQLKAALDYELIYAIYKQRLRRNGGKRITFEKIFELYEQGELPGYDGEHKMAFSKTLERYYHRHEPKTDSM